MTSLLERYQGCLVGLACGDAVGTTVEFMPRGSFEPLTDMVGGGPFGLAPGQWTDDTSMALCLAESLLQRKGFDAADQMNRYVNWWRWGHLSSTGECFDIGGTVTQALQRYLATNDPMAGSTDPQTAGNGGLMRLAPLVLVAYPDAAKVRSMAREGTATTHAATEALECSELMAEVLVRGLEGRTREEMLAGLTTPVTSPAVVALKEGRYVDKPESAIVGSGYCVASLEAALWCFAHAGSFEEAVLRAANLGNDADTTAAIVGQIAGAHHGLQGIPTAWRERLHMEAEIERFAADLLALAQA